MILFYGIYFMCIFGLAGVLGIRDGKITTIKKHPYLVAVDCGIDFLCPGAIIGKSWVLYTADCANGNTADEIQVLVGSGEKWSGTSYQVEEMHVHPSYSEGSLDYNYALLKIEGKFTFSTAVKAASLPSNAAKAGTKLTVVGWGGPTLDDKLREGVMKVYSEKECQSYYDSTTITSRMGCLYNNGSVTPCYNDYSDPVTKGNVLHHLVASVSEYCDSTSGPAITAAVFPALSWIKSITGIE